MMHSPLYKNRQITISGKEMVVEINNDIQLQSDSCVYLICPRQGVFSTKTKQGNFILHTSHVLVLPARQACQLRSSYGVTHVIEISCAVWQDTQHLRILKASNLSRSLMTKVIQFGEGPEDTVYENAVMSLLVCELARRNTVSDSVALVMPNDKRLLRVCEELLQDPALPGSVDDWCSKACMSRRSFTRAFKRETGVTFAMWRREVRLFAGLSQIIAGEQVSLTAYDVGYESVSAFTTAFSQRFGVPPTHYKPKIGDTVLPVVRPKINVDARQMLPG